MGIISTPPSSPTICWAAVFAALVLIGLHRRQSDSIYLPISVVSVDNAQLNSIWCPSANTVHYPTKPFPTNFWFVKTPKTGGTTLAGVFRSICAHTGIIALKWHMASDLLKDLQQLDTYMQAAYNLSDTASIAILSHMRYAEDKAALFKQPLLMFTAVRHPLARIHSGFVQQLCITTAQRQGRSPNECDSNATFIQQALQQDTVDQRWAYARGKKQQNELFNYIRGSAETVQEAAAIYDFIFVSERMNEALVVFMLEYGLRFEDIAYLSSKNRTGKYRTASDLPKELNDYIESSNSQDVELWHLANQKLDDRIAELQKRCGGQDVVAAALQTFEMLLAEVRHECSDYVGWYTAHGFGPPYSYEADRGLGHRCVGYTVRRLLEGGV